MTTSDDSPVLPAGSLLDNAQFTWSTAQSVKYETAVEVISELVAACTEQIAEQESLPDPDAELVSRLTTRQNELIAERHRLNSQDHEAVDAVLAEYGPQLRRPERPE